MVSDMDMCFRSECFKDVASSNLGVPLPRPDSISIGEVSSKGGHDFLSKHDLDISLLHDSSRDLDSPVCIVIMGEEGETTGRKEVGHDENDEKREWPRNDVCTDLTGC